ncbi:signal peptidase I [Halovivax cerinus]|uniref:Signal peptidase I n=1 Tax=Halovivax cerinus TaxID=1487865 RepID=A0ABD5NR50_9EURY|nr:signal peptidase I [Halovivax cerinus]
MTPSDGDSPADTAAEHASRETDDVRSRPLGGNRSQPDAVNRSQSADGDGVRSADAPPQRSTVEERRSGEPISERAVDVGRRLVDRTGSVLAGRSGATRDGDPRSVAVDAVRSRVADLSWRQVGHAVGVLVLIAIVLPFVIYAVPQVVGADQSYVVLSGSMEPAIETGDAIVVDSVDPAAIDDGDIITFDRTETTPPTTHRVLDVTQQDGELAYETKGDANEDPDQELVVASQVRGRVVSIGGQPFTLPFVGTVVSIVGTRVGFVALVVVPIVALVLSEAYDLVSDGDAQEGDSTRRTDITESSPRTGPGAVAAVSAAGAASPSEPPVASGDAAPSESTAPGASDQVASEAWMTIRPADLGLALVALAAFLVYCVWVVYDQYATAGTIEPWAMGVTAGVATALFLLGTMYVRHRQQDDSSSKGSHRRPDDRAPRVSATGPAGGRSVESLTHRDTGRAESGVGLRSGIADASVASTTLQPSSGERSVEDLITEPVADGTEPVSTIDTGEPRPTTDDADRWPVTDDADRRRADSDPHRGLGADSGRGRSRNAATATGRTEAVGSEPVDGTGSSTGRTSFARGVHSGSGTVDLRAAEAALDGRALNDGQAAFAQVRKHVASDGTDRPDSDQEHHPDTTTRDGPPTHDGGWSEAGDRPEPNTGDRDA